MRNQLSDTCADDMREVEVDVGCISLKPFEYFSRRSAEDVVYLVDLILLVVAWKQREETEDLEEDAACAPDVHLVVVVPVSQQTFRRAIPSRRYVFLIIRYKTGCNCKGLLRVDSSARAEIC